MPPAGAAGAAIFGAGAGAGAEPTLLGPTGAIGATAPGAALIIATSFEVKALGSLGSNRSPLDEDPESEPKMSNRPAGAFLVTATLPASFAAMSLNCCFEGVLDASDLAAAMDGLEAIIFFFTSSSNKSCSNSAFLCIAARDISPSFFMSLGEGPMKALATAGGAVGAFAFGSAGGTRDGSLVRKLKNPPGAGAFFNGTGAGALTAGGAALGAAAAGSFFSTTAALG